MRVGLLGMMFIVFLTLKLAEVITWSWWWVTAPLWGGFVAIGVLLVIALLIKIIERTNK